MKSYTLIVWKILSVFVFIFSVGTWLAIPEEIFLNSILSAIAVIVIATAMTIHRKSVLLFLRSRYFHNLGSNFITILLTGFLLSLIAYVGYKSRYQVDITKQQVNSLSAQSKKLLENLEGELKMTLFAKRESWRPYLGWPELFRAYSTKIKLDVINIDAHPQLVEVNNIRENGTLVMEYEGQKIQVLAKDELSIANGILKLLRSEPISVYFSVGHGELSIRDHSLDGVSKLASFIEAQNYIVKEISLEHTTQLPEDMRVLAILGARSGFTKKEIELIDKYVSRGGNLIFAYAPMFEYNYLQNVFDLALKWGVELYNELVVDRISKVEGADASVPMVANYHQDHVITRGLQQKAIFPLSAGVKQAKKPLANTQYTALAQTSKFPASWAESDLDQVRQGKLVFKEKEDRPGPIDLAASVELYKPGTNIATNRLVFFGTSSFIVNGHVQHSANFNFFLNALSWAAHDEGIVALNRPTLKTSPIFMSAGQINVLLYSSVIILPLLLLMYAFYLYRKRLRL